MQRPLLKKIIKRIKRHGPITVADYMAQCLMDLEHGYYQQRPVFGTKGDFITAPEVSQIFGEMVGLWVADRWQALGCPKQVNLIELGPGRGTLMADILRITQKIPGFHQALSLHMVELSDQLRRQQQDIVTPYHIPLTHHQDFKDIQSDQPSIILGNEFFDALPIQQFQKKQGVWYERMVTVTDTPEQQKTGDKKAPTLSYALSPASAQLTLAHEYLRRAAKDGDVIEVCPAALSITADIAALLHQNTGAALFFDYGYSNHLCGDSFQALKNHAYVDPLAEPGFADLTAHVNFRALADAATEKGLHVTGPVEQGHFLMTLGAGHRAQQLASGKSAETQQEILEALKRLTAPDQMGQLFKVIAFEQGTQSPAPGF